MKSIGRIFSKCRIVAFALTASLAWAAPAAAVEYRVGPGQPLATPNDVPWESLQPGDIVSIYWRSTPYKNKWVICRRGTAAAPIVVRGINGPQGQQASIDGNGATTRSQLNFWSGVRGVIAIAGASSPADTMPAYITIDNLEVTGGHPNYSFTDFDGSVKSYAGPASSIFVEKGEHITIRNTTIHDSSNGLFVASSDSALSRDILIQNNYVYGNGVVGDHSRHGTYMAALGIVYEGNRYGPMRAGATGGALKDRSAGVVVRYNWIEGGNRQLEVLDAEDAAALRNDPSYRTTYVYGNVLVENPNDGNRQIVQYGGDHPGMEDQFRKGWLYFYNNTIISYRTDTTVVIRLSTNEERADIRNNIFYVTAAGSNLALLDDAGIGYWSHNWIKPGWVVSYGGFGGQNFDDGTWRTGSNPGFAGESSQNFELAATSVNVNAGMALHAAVLPTNDLTRQYVKHQSTTSRALSLPIDIGAFEFGAGGTPPNPPQNLRISP
jgi:hypothetical protein